MPRPVRRSDASGRWWRDALRAAARPSAFGVCAIAAASSGCRAAMRNTWPPEAEKPQTASRVGSTPGRVGRTRSPPASRRADPDDGQDLARLPAAVPTMAVVEGEDSEPRVLNRLRKQVGAGLHRHREPSGHDHAGAVGPRVVPPGARRVAADEVNLLPLNGHLGGLDLMRTRTWAAGSGVLCCW